MKNNIRNLRLTLDLTQEDLAIRVGVSRQTIISIERGRYIPSLPLAYKLSLVFNKNIEDMFDFEGGDTYES